MSTDYERPWANRWLFVFYLALLVWAPIPLGSNRPWAWAILELWVFALAIWWLLDFARGKIQLSQALKGAWPALLCAALWSVYVWLQLVPLPLELLQALSPEAARAHAAAAWPAAASAAPLTLDQYGTLDGALKSAAYVAFFALSLALLDRPGRIAIAAYILVISGFAQAMYGGLTSLSETGADAHGSFANRDHFAAYLVMCLSVGLGLLISELTGEVSRSWKQFFRNVVAWILSPKMRLRLALVVMVIALVLTRSRMGNTSFFLSLLITGGIGLVLAKRASRSMVVLIASLIVIDIFIVGAYFGVQRVLDRIEQTTMQAEDRDEVASDAIGMWKDYPVFGSGLGSFQVVFPRYSQQDLGALFTHAHNDYLQFASETGVVGIALLGLLVFTSFLAALRAQIIRHDPLMRAISFGAMMAIIALGMHSAVDFNLQIPANALTFMLLLAFAWISLYHGYDGESQAEPGSQGAGVPGRGIGSRPNLSSRRGSRYRSRGRPSR
ncbi:MAG: O-antigen ligase family protein [Betaproteobacteria bacterium]|nr:O-antigen ligase family protein [Betaproteobacteria bacterium]